MVMRYNVTVAFLLFVYILSMVSPVWADKSAYTFPYKKVKSFLLKETGYVAASHHINGYHDDGRGTVTVYCTRVAVGNEIIGQILYQFILLETDNGPKWLYLGNVKSQFIN